MNKLKLELDALAVESFDIDLADDERGTVEALSGRTRRSCPRTVCCDDTITCAEPV